MTDLRQIFRQLRLSQYFEVFVTEGFDTWETVLDIRESDLNSLNVKLGHRRKLQRAIAEARRIPLERVSRAIPPSYGAPSVNRSHRNDCSASKSLNNKRTKPPWGNQAGATKRKYHRHPKPDENAPGRPASTYVLFSNQIRESLKGQELSFTEIAKLVGERWQTLSPSSREAYERQMAAAKEKYYAELAEYKTTPEYAQYQEYLAEFRAKHNQQQSDKQSKVDPENNTNARSSSHGHCDKPSRRRVSDAYFSQPSLVHHRSGSRPLPGPHRASGRMLGSESTSPATYLSSGVNSPRFTEEYSPMSASPTSASASREPDFSHQPTSTRSTNSREWLKDPPYPSMHNFNFPHIDSISSVVTPSSKIYSGQAPSERDLSSRRLYRESSSLPSLVHEDTTNTNHSSQSGSYHTNIHGGPYTGSLLPLPDAQKTHRLLPQPIPSSLSMTPSPLYQRPALLRQLPTKFLAAQPQPQHELWQTSSSAVLLQAGELVSRSMQTRV